MNNADQKQKDIQQWITDIANNKIPRKKLIFDKKTKKLVPVSPEDPRADDNLEFTKEEAQRFIL